MARSTYWRSGSFVALVIVVVVTLLHVSTDLIDGLERRVYDLGSTHTGRTPSDRIAVIAIDNRSIENVGRWPWPRDLHAQMIDLLVGGGAKTIAHTAFFFDPQIAEGLPSLRGLREMIQGNAPADLGPVAKEWLTRYINERETALDRDERLAASIRSAGNVVLPAFFLLGEPEGPPDAPLAAYGQRHALSDTQGWGLPAIAAQMPLGAFGEPATGIGHLNQWLDSDGVLRQEPLLIHFDGYAMPSMALVTAARSLNLGTADLGFEPGVGVRLGRRLIPTDDRAMVLPQFYPDRNGHPAFSEDSFFDVLSGQIPASKYAGKIVIIGATAAGVGTVFSSPISPAMAPASILAHVTSSILQNHFIEVPAWAGGMEGGVFLLIAVYLVAVLPRRGAARGAWVSGGLFVGLLGLEYGLLAWQAVWLQMVLPALLLLFGYLALTTRRYLVTETRTQRADAESAETNRQMGLALLGQGQPDQAFDRFRRVPHSDALMANLSQLALDFERRRQFGKAQSVYEHMLGLEPGDSATQERLERVRRLDDSLMLGTQVAHPGGNLVLDTAGLEKPMLGRYRIEKALGKGAMGVVYQGQDPTIGRVVAIKTLALSAEFEGPELQAVRERFFREAETAGRLQHPHIVTIFDAGEEHDLAYIAMEFLRGHDLTAHTRPGRLLPAAEVLRIGQVVAQALDHAHEQQVVHRDVKPGNVMYDPASGGVKVTDFGIARVTGSSRTKTGVVLGTPSFMSPEQLAGRRIDGRSDLYSLGVMLFQMLTGSLPFQADSMAALMYQIANQPAPDLSSLRPDLPPGLGQLLAAVLAKDPALRPQRGRDLAEALARWAASVAPEAPAAAEQPGNALATEALPGAASPTQTAVQTQVWVRTESDIRL